MENNNTDTGFKYTYSAKEQEVSIIEDGRNAIFFLCKLIFQKHYESIFLTNREYYQLIKFKEVTKNGCYRNY